MTADDLTMKLGGGVICKCGTRKDPRLVMCNDCMRLAMGPQEEAVPGAPVQKPCTEVRCTRLAKPGNLYCKHCQAMYMRKVRAEQERIRPTTRSFHQEYTDPGHWAAQNYWRQEMEKYGENE